MRLPVLIAAASAVAGRTSLNERQEISTTTSTTTVTLTVLLAVTETSSAVRSPAIEMHATTPTATSSPAQTATPSSMALSNICFPKAADKQPDLSYPCNSAEYILRECASDFAKGYERNSMSNNTQRLCACGSQIFNEWTGCAECLEAHGYHTLAPQIVHKISISYCAASATPTHDLLDAMMPLISGLHEAKEMKNVSYPSSTAKTDHWKPSVAGSAALQVPQTTTSAGKTVIAVATSSGQLVPLQKASSTVNLQGPQDLTATISSYTVTPSPTPKADNSNRGARVCGASVAAVGLAALALMF